MQQPTGVDHLLTRARSGSSRLTPTAVVDHLRAGALLVDTWTEIQRAEQGELPARWSSTG